ncbi:hypothetical protein SPFL3101_02879 [Sporomusaceae bacterium FL31]|nr:hypothetical protein SPFL3101_02879 [Sporomusaceae bacterium FL31]
MLSLYFLWGEFFPEPTIVNQIIFNFALFYPVGFLNGYFKDPGGVLRVLPIAFLFNIMTYVLAFAVNVKIPLLLAALDFVTMFVFLYLGILIGRRTE